MTRNGVVLPALAAVLMLSNGCGQKETTTASAPAAADPAAAPATAPVTPSAQPTGAAPAAAPAVVGSAEYREDSNLRADVLELRRVSGGALYVKWRLTNATPPAQQAGLTEAQQPKPIYYTYGNWSELYFVDPAENKKYENLKDSEGNNIGDLWYGNLAPGESKTSWAKFPAPPPTSTKISLTLPRFSPLEDVPISQ
jgi:hypothetical protein